MKRNHVVICSHLLAVGNEILSYVGSFNISAADDGVKTSGAVEISLDVNVP